MLSTRVHRELKACSILKYRGRRAGRLRKNKKAQNRRRFIIHIPTDYFVSENNILVNESHWNAGSLCVNESQRNHLDYCYTRPMGVNVNNLIYVDRIHSRSTDQPLKGVEFCLLNARSICNKSRVITNFIPDYDLDILAVTETWLRGNDYDDYFVQDICPAD